MRILMLAERARADATDPLDRRVFDVAAGLAARGHAVRLVACAEPGDVLEDAAGALRVHRVADYPPMIPHWDAVSRALQAGIGLFERGIASLLDEPADLIHGVGWRCAQPAIGLCRAFDLPLVASIDHPRRIARHGRRWGRGDDLIEQSERWVATEASRVIVRSQRARRLLADRFAIEPGRIDVIPTPRARDDAGRQARLAGRIEQVYLMAAGVVPIQHEDVRALSLAHR